MRIAIIILSLSCLILGGPDVLVGAVEGPVAFDIREFGAVGDGRTPSTGAIQRAIDTAAEAGGGTVIVPSGRYLSGGIRLRSFVTLQLDAGAVLLGSAELSDYPENVPDFRSYTDNYVRRSLIYAENARDMAIVGRGTIDGRGAAFTDPAYLVRPDLIRLVSCENVLLRDITLRDSAMWVVHLLACDFVVVSGVRVISQVNANNDMLDIDCCRNVRVSDCYADTGDDAIVLKSTADRVCENVTVANCVLRSYCNAIKMGTESSGGFRNVTISNCAIESAYGQPGYYRRDKGISGVSLEIVDGGTMENVSISNLVMRGVSVPIFIRLGNRARPFKPGMDKPGVGRMRNITITGVTATGVDKIGCSITGLPGHPIENVDLRDIKIDYPGGGTAAEAGAQTPELPDSYPEATMFGTLPAYGFFCRHVDGLRFENIDLRLAADDSRPAFVCRDVRRLRIEGATVERKPSGGGPLVVLDDVRGALVQACSPPVDTSIFIRLEGGCERINVIGNALAGIGKVVEFGPGVPQSALYRAANGPAGRE